MVHVVSKTMRIDDRRGRRHRGRVRRRRAGCNALGRGVAQPRADDRAVSFGVAGATAPTAAELASPSATVLDGVTVTSIPLGVDAYPLDVVSAFGSIWVAEHRHDLVRRLDPSTLQTTAEIGPIVGPGWFAVTPDAVWVTNQNGVGMSRLDPSTNTVAATVGDLPDLRSARLRPGEHLVLRLRHRRARAHRSGDRHRHRARACRGPGVADRDRRSPVRRRSRRPRALRRGERSCRRGRGLLRRAHRLRRPDRLAVRRAEGGPCRSRSRARWCGKMSVPLLEPRRISGRLGLADRQRRGSS